MKHAGKNGTNNDESMSASNILQQTDEEAILPDDGEQACVQSGKTRYAKRIEVRLEEKQRRKYAYKILFCIALVIILSYGILKGYGMIKTYSGREAVIARFTEALEEKNLSKLKKYIRVPDSAIRVNEKNLQPLFAYLTEHPEGYKKIRYQLEKQNEKERVYIKGLTSEPPIFLMRVYEKQHIFLNQYVFEPAVYSLVVHVEGKNVMLYVNGKHVYTTESEMFSGKIGSYLPGVYEITAVKKEDNETKQQRKKIVLFGGPKAQSVHFVFK
ncbi:TcaA second domain-containing protein [Bacillus alveayuensis]|uniref:TcaA second domain-containing protein n=1 Tax=Aeribacillus alveayuensis TaxID=279215 RepID=UPI0006990600|nr:hypothetical protein [Bacillus alveayuensis]